MRICNAISKAILLCGLIVVSACGGSGDADKSVTVENLYSFGGGSADAMGPGGVIVEGYDGNFYGVTSGGGIGGGPAPRGQFFGDGTVFKITPAGIETLLHSFNRNGSDAQNPLGLFLGSDGNLYGTTISGSVFKVTPEGVETILYTFASPSDSHPNGLIQGDDGNFYGTTEGSSGSTLFKLTPGGVLTILHQFSGDDPGNNLGPHGELLQASDGNLYGMALGGATGNGAVFKITPEGVFTTLYSFAGPPADGDVPTAGLIQGSDGKLYGTTTYGGADNGGIAFNLTLDGTETVLHSFTSNASAGDGHQPIGPMIEGTDGNLYGTTAAGGKKDYGTIFRLTPGGAETILYSFGVAPNDGTYPWTNLVQARDGSFYGTTNTGGAYGAGTFFRLTLHDR